MYIFLQTLCEVAVMFLTDHTESSELSGAEWGENSLQGDSHNNSPMLNCQRVPQGSNCGLQQEQELSPAGRQERLPRGQNYEEVDDEGEGEKKFF